MLAVVDNKQELPVGQVAGHEVKGGDGTVVAQPEGFGGRAEDTLLGVHLGQPHEPGAVREPRASPVAARSASRVLPTPPGPTRLTSRAVASRARSSASSRRRPMKLLASAGRFPQRPLAVAIRPANHRYAEGSTPLPRGAT